MVLPLRLSSKKRPHSPDEVSDDEIDIPPVSSKRARFPNTPLIPENRARNRIAPDLPSILLQPLILGTPGPASPYSSVPGSAGYIDPTRFEISDLSALFSGSYSNEYTLQGLSSLSMIARDIAGTDIHPSSSREALSGTFANPVYLLRGHPEMRRAQRQELVDLSSRQDVDDIALQHALIDDIDSFFDINGVSIFPPGSSEENIEAFEGADEELQPFTSSSASVHATGDGNTLAIQQNGVQAEQAQTNSNGATSVGSRDDESEDHTHAWSFDHGRRYHE